MNFNVLEIADLEFPNETSTGSDGHLIRESGKWIEQKHEYLVYYSKIFNEGMKNHWKSRYYVEFFAGPGKCRIRDTNKEVSGSALRAMDLDFTKYIFIEKSKPIAEALRSRLENHPKKDQVEIWVGDCNEAVDLINIPLTCLSFAFIDPTKIDHCPFTLIAKARRKSKRIDLLINIPIGMDIKRNINNYFKQSGPEAHLTRYLNGEKWRAFPQAQPSEFARMVISEFEQGLRNLNWGHVGSMQTIVSNSNSPLYYLYFASSHKTGKKFWDETVKYCNEPELAF